ncbi:aminotransferase class IV [bacterium]|nr:aminotransferase class IV [bacterium]MBU1958786.1 aminotransferase class IV [bacterium]
MNKKLLETIKIENGQIMNIEWHNQRFNKSRQKLFNEPKALNLEGFITAPEEGIYRCRILYDKEIHSVEYLPYVPKEIKHFKIIQSQMDYAYKYSDRKELERLIPSSYDEIIIEKNGFLTDTSMANIAFYNGEAWFTPKYPLLEGTTRERLLSENFLKLKNIRSHEIQSFTHFALMNAMIGFKIQKHITIRL